MVDIMSLKKDENFAIKRDVLNTLSSNGVMENLRA